jgi:hypothetical protein
VALAVDGRNASLAKVGRAGYFNEHTTSLNWVSGVAGMGAQMRIGVSLSLVAIGSAMVAAAATDPCLENRSYVRGGTGVGQYSVNLTLKKVTIDEFMAQKYPGTIRTSADLPSNRSPRNRLGGIESILYEIEGFATCGGYGGLNNSLVMELEHDGAIDRLPHPSFGYPGASCRVGSPNRDVIKSFDTFWADRIGAGFGCGLINRWVRIRGYGFWTDSGVISDLKDARSSVVPSIFPLVDLIVLDGPGGNVLTPDCAEFPGSTSTTKCINPNGDGSGNPTPTPTPTPTPVPTPTAAGPTVVLSDDTRAFPIAMTNASSTTVLVSVAVPSEASTDVTLTTTTDSDDLVASITPSTLLAPGAGDALVTIRTTSNTRAGDHFVTVTASDGVTSSSASIFVTVLCDPPFILGIDQPKGITVSSGRPANLSVKASGSGPLTYQWFTGSTGLVNFPLAVGSSPNFTTSALNDTTSYWVRVTNPCGSVDSQTVTVNVGPGAKPASNPRH